MSLFSSSLLPLFSYSLSISPDLATNSSCSALYSAFSSSESLYQPFFLCMKFSKPYCFQNDERINYLSQQLLTIGEFGITSRDDIYAKAQELQRTIHQMRSNGENSEPEETNLKSINELIKSYEEIVEGNYIDNLIRAQKSREAAAQKTEKSPKHKR